jgi:hypothetical protein
MAASFLRVQEHYESRKFHGRVFTLEDYMDWYAKEYGNFTYYQDWDGFNVPSSAFEPFYRGKFDPLSKKETRLLDLLRNESGKFYVIGILEDSNDLENDGLQHEIAHALYHVDLAYQREVRRLMKGYDLAPISRQLMKMSYHRSVVSDEIQAYMVGSTDQIPASITKPLAPLRREIRRVYRRHARHIKAVPA